jgi:hypothetical protein
MEEKNLVIAIHFLFDVSITPLSEVQFLVVLFVLRARLRSTVPTFQFNVENK